MYLEPLLPDKVYHIYNHANGNENLFRTKENYRYFLEKYAAYILPIAETYAYCLMPNHFHLMVRVRSEEVLLAFFKDKLLRSSLQGFDQGEALRQLVSAQFSHLFNAYSKAYNKLYGRMGSLFVPRFKRKLVDGDSYFAQLIAYIHLNPVRHGFCDHVLD